MNVKIKSDFDFQETLYDRAFGLAKKMIINDKKSGVSRSGSFVCTAKNKDGEVIVTIRKEKRHD